MQHYDISIINTIIHLDKYLGAITCSGCLYFLIFIVVFSETGLVITPFLPGDSLLFISGSLSAINYHLSVYLILLTVILATFFGDNSNFFIGTYLGHKLFKNPKSKIFRQDLLSKTHDFYQKHGSGAIIIGRFIPIVRTFVPFVAGMSSMTYKKFITYSICSSCIWCAVFVLGGYFFGNIQIIKSHTPIVILVVMILSILPIVKHVCCILWKKRCHQ